MHVDRQNFKLKTRYVLIPISMKRGMETIVGMDASMSIVQNSQRQQELFFTTINRHPYLIRLEVIVISHYQKTICH